MTQPWFSDRVVGPSVHVLVIGVGRYPHARGAPWKLTDLPAAATSAVDFAIWCREELEPPGARVGTVELLVASPAPPLETTAAPTFAEVEAAVDRWVKRLDTDANHIGIFYFAGHGVRKGDQLALLCEDFASNARDPFRHAIDSNGFTLGMDSIAARRQLLLLDACRDTPAAAATAQGTLGQPLLLPNPTGVSVHSRATIYATEEGKKAWSPPSGRTRFTDALLRALELGVAARKRGSEWLVDASTLHNATSELLLREETRPGFSPIHCQQAALDGGRAFEFHRRSQAPVVPVAVYCEPRNRTNEAVFQVRDLQGGPIDARGQDPSDWELTLPQDTYEFVADTPLGQSAERVMVIPVFLDHSVQL